MKSNIAIHISAVHMHMPSAGALLECAAQIGDSISTPGAALRGVIVPPDIVLDQSTGLMWSKATIAKGKTWAKAKEAAEAVRLGGYADWRLPTRAELLTLVDDTRSNPCIDVDKFDCDSEWYWSSTPLASSPSGCAWGVDFYSGGALYGRQGSSGRVRAVRSVAAPASGQ